MLITILWILNVHMKSSRKLFPNTAPFQIQIRTILHKQVVVANFASFQVQIKFSLFSGSIDTLVPFHNNKHHRIIFLGHHNQADYCYWMKTHFTHFFCFSYYPDTLTHSRSWSELSCIYPRGIIIRKSRFKC